MWTKIIQSSLAAFLLYAFVIFNTTSVLAQELPEEEAPWKFTQIELVESDAFAKQVAELVTSGYYPHGLAAAEEEVLIVSSRQNTNELEYFIKFFDITDNFAADFAAFLRSGWNPVGLDSFANGMLALFLNNGSTNILGWKLEAIGSFDSNDIFSRSQDIFTAELNNDYIPFSLLHYNGQLYLGLLRSAEKPEYSRFVLDSFPNDGTSFISGINNRLNEGFSINGFQFVDNRIFLSFIR